MSEYVQFFLTHWQLSGAFSILLVAFVISILYEKQSKGRCSPHQAVELINHQRAVVLDFRDKELYEQGHIANAINLSFEKLAGQYKRIQKFKENPMIIIARNSLVGKQISQKLQQEGFANLLELVGGMDAWRQANFPVVKH